MKFEELALDVLCPIFDLIGPYDIGRIWLCGSSRLLWALSDGHTLLKFEYEFNSRFPLRFPSLVSHLSSLTHLSVKYSLLQPLGKTNSLQIPPLPRKLGFFDFRQSLAIIDFKSLIERDAGQFPVLHTLVLHQYSKIHFESLDLRRLGALTALEVFHPPAAHIANRMLHLPPNLIDLSIGVLDVTPEWVSSLPASLSRLYLRFSSCTPFFHALPRHLMHLVLESGNLDCWLPQWQDLPRGLISFQINSRCLVTPSMVSDLPRTLTDISVGVYLSGHPSNSDLLAFWKEMPPTLKKMGKLFWPLVSSQALIEALPRSLCQEAPYGIPFEVISALPRGIESLRVISLSHPKNPSQVEYPPHLRSLNQGIKSDEILSRLPPNLTRLEAVGKYKTFTKEQARLLPRKLRYLAFFASNQNKSSESWIELPRTLSTLVMNATEFDDAAKEHEIAEKMAEDLPPLLRELQLHYAIVCPAFYFHLPTTLQIIRITVKDLPLTSYEALSTRFPVLSHITITSEVAPDSWRPIIATMPKTTIEFEWQIFELDEEDEPEKTDLTNSDMALLPRGLSKLSLPLSPQVGFACQSSLPPFSEMIILGNRRLIATSPTQ